MGKLLIWFDNCGCHKTAIVQDYIEEIEIDVAYLPPNMTAILQVLDLVVNGPLKAHVRQLRAKRLVRGFKEFMELYREDSEKVQEDRENPTFVPPKPEMIQAVVDLFQLFENGFKEEKFRNGIKSSFIKTGTMPTRSDDSDAYGFVEYTANLINGTMKTVVPTGTKVEQVVKAIPNDDVVLAEAINMFLDAEDVDEVTDEGVDAEDNEDGVTEVLNDF